MMMEMMVTGNNFNNNNNTRKYGVYRSLVSLSVCLYLAEMKASMNCQGCRRYNSCVAIVLVFHILKA